MVKNNFWIFVLFMVSVSLFQMNAEKKKTKLKDIKADTSVIYSDESYLYRSPAYPELNDKVTVKLRVAAGDINSAAVRYKTGGTEASLQMKKVVTDKNFDYYLGVIPPVTDETLYFFELNKADTTFYYSRNGISVKYPSSSYKFKIFPGFKTPEWMKGAVLYQIFIDRFNNGNKANDVVTNEYMYDNYPAVSKKWNELPSSTTSYEDGSDRTREFFGGDIDGVIQKLPYLKSIGVDGIYFNPVFVSPSNHKYDAQDYENVDPHLGVILDDDPTLITPEKDPGYKSKDMNRSSPINKEAKKYITRTTSKKNLDASNEKLQELITKADALGIKVILDGVFNHCGSFNKWLDREHLYAEDGAYESKDSKYNKFFKFTNDTWPDNESYESWWGYKTLPKLNYDESEELVDSIMKVAEKWIKSGVAGWRLDVASDLGHTAKYNHKFWEMLRTRVKQVNPDAVVFAEVYGDASSWLKGKEWDTIMNYDSFFEPLSFFFTGMEKHSYSYTGKLHNNVTEFDKMMKESMAKMPWQSLEIAMNQLDNHDHSRFITRTNGMIDEGKDKNIRNPALADKNLNKGILKEAVVFQMTWMGAPTLYYGNEAGLPGWTDPDDRRTFPWGNEDQELMSFYKKAIKLHKEYDSIKNGGTITLITDDKAKVYSYGRWNEKDAVIVALNNDSVSHTVAIPGYKLGFDKNTRLEQVFKSNKDAHSDSKSSITANPDGNFIVTVDPFGSVVLAGKASGLEWKPDQIPALKVVSVTPENGTVLTGDKSVTIEFNDVVNKDTLLSGITADKGVTFNYAVNGKFVTLTPKSKLKAGEYSIKLNNSLSSLYGNFPLNGEISFSFVVAK